jgi:LacI family transcriptional regulator
MAASKSRDGGPITIKALAAHLDVAHSTVSRALSDHAHISPETKERVRRAARELGYIVNSGARFLRTGHSEVVGLLVPDITNEFYSSVARILAEECSERGRPLILSVSEDDPQRELSLVQALLEARPAALVVTLTANPKKETLYHLGSTQVIQFLRSDPRVRGHSMTIDDTLGGRLAAEHLADLGHKHIGFIGVPETLSTGAARLRGYRAALLDRGIPPVIKWQKLCPPNADAGARAFSELIALDKPPKAVFVASPQLALGVARVVQEKRIRVPADISLIAYGNSSWFGFFAGGLTTISLPLQELATAATSILFRELKQPSGAGSSAPTTAALAPVLVKRGSTARPRE